jgi:hypothetical protein
MTEPRPVAQRTDSGAADMQSLIQLGYASPQPTPEPPPGTLEPAPAPELPPDPVDEQEKAAIQAALTEAGVAATPEDQAAVQALARLDPATVDAVTRWLRTKKPEPKSTK